MLKKKNYIKTLADKKWVVIFFFFLNKNRVVHIKNNFTVKIKIYWL